MIEYTFSTIKYQGEPQKVLRTKGESTSYLEGKYQTFEKKLLDQTITESCKIGPIIKKETDSANNTYVWYLVSDYAVKVDNSPKYNKEIKKTNAAVEFLFMMGGYEPFEDGEDNNEQNV